MDHQLYWFFSVGMELRKAHILAFLVGKNWDEQHTDRPLLVDMQLRSGNMLAYHLCNIKLLPLPVKLHYQSLTNHAVDVNES